MADKVVAIKIDVQGTADQKRKLEGLEKTLQGLTEQQRKLKKQLKDGAITRDQYAKSIAKVNLGLKGTRRQLLVTRQAMLGIDGFTTRLGKSFARLGTSISAAFVGLFAAQKLFQVVSDGVNTIKDFEQQMAKVKAITGATNEEFQDLQASAKDLGSTTQFTASQVGKLQEEYAKLGFTTKEILDASEATLELATATGSDLAQSAKVAASTIKGFGLTAKDTQKVVDIMAKSFTSSALDINKFETAMSSVAPVAAAVGFSIEQTTASLGILTDAGFDASTAGTALRNILLDTQKAGISVTEAFRQVRESTDPATKSLDLFGKRGAAVGLTLAKNEDKANAFAKSLENAGGAASAMARIVGDTLDGDLKRLSSAWEGLILNFSETDSLRDIVQFTTDLVSGISGLTKNVYEQSDAMEDQRATISVLVGRITSLNEGTEDRKKLINELNAISPDFLKGLDQENLKNETLAKRLKTVNDQLVNKIIIQRKTDEIDAQAEKTTDKKIANREALIELEKRLDERKAKGAKSIERARKGELSRLLTTQDAVDNFIKSEEKRQAIYTDFNKSTVQRAQAINALSKAEKTASIFSENLNALISKAFLAEQELNDEKKKSEVLISERIKLEEELGITTEKSTDADKDAAAAALNAANANKELGKSFKFIAEELEDLDDDNEKFEENFVDINKGKEESQQAFFDFIDEGYQESFDLNQKLLDQDVEAFGKSLLDKQKLEEDNEKQKAIIKQELIKGGIEVANAAATALVDVAGRKAEREKDIELSNLDAKLENGLITQEEFESKKLEIEKKAFKQKKKLELANIAISLATEIASIQAAAAANPLNAVTFGGAGLTQSSVLTGIAIAKSAVQAGIVASQSFAEGGYTGGGVGTPDATGFRQAGVVHEGEYVVPKNVLESNGGSRLVGALESMRNNRPQPYLSAGFANGGFSSGGSGLDLTDMENRISKAVISSIGSIQVVNVATETTTQANRVNNIQSEATFG
tara:strand:- start:448 stop:3423 length:2976 start_codon:yes stop_codon:yes gene_type:complete